MRAPPEAETINRGLAILDAALDGAHDHLTHDGAHAAADETGSIAQI